MKDKVIAVVVTYNRKKLLLECLDAIFQQTYSISRLILIDNCSTDGTMNELVYKGYLNHPKITYIKTETNIGGAGGFYEGMRKSIEYSHDWIWLMDDDTIPSNDCLEQLINASRQINTKISFLASAIYGTNGEFMNVPIINMRKSENGYQYWYQYLGKGIVNIKAATFVSILINQKSIQKCGLPCKDFFIWGDDTEYTTRLTTFYEDAYLVGKSVAIHKRANARSISLESETNSDRIDMFYYFYRNSNIINWYYKSNMYAFTMFLFHILVGLKLLFKPNGCQKVKAVLKGSLKSILQYHKFKNYIDTQLH
ncbi:galactofuranosyltransferase GlfT1 [Lachnospiraceae bacterium]|nr:galactofuranosyltransferase GlfT1 [Lachnospiraceae bacterium]